MKIIFLGTPSFAVPCLEALINSRHQVCAVVTQPEKQTGRGRKVVCSPVEVYAGKHNIPVYKFNKIRLDGVKVLQQIDADIMVSCAYGQILSEDILNMKKYGVVNVHASLLPKLRGSSPIQWSIINGDKLTGITIMKSCAGIDDGPVILQKSIEILKNETASELFGRLSVLASELLIEGLNLIENGKAKYTEQNHNEATFCYKLTKEMSELNFNQLNASKIINLINGLNIWPVCEVTVNKTALKFYNAALLSDEQINKLNINQKNYKNGEIIIADSKNGLVIKAQNGFIEILKMQTAGTKIMSAKSFLNGRKIETGSVVNE